MINEVDPSEWLIYWRKMNGDVAGGIIRMITNVTSSNSYKKHLSCKWIEESESIVSKIVDPVYDIIRSDMCSNQEAIAELPKAPRRSSYDLVVTS